MLTELKVRGVTDVLILCCDGLKGLPESVAEVWPLATVQTCVVHLMRNTFRYTSTRDWATISKALKEVYHAPSVDAAEAQFAEFRESWGERYPAVVKLWTGSGETFTPFLSLPVEIRKLVYTTDVIVKRCWSRGSWSRGWRAVVEREQFLLIVGDLRHRLGELRPVCLGERGYRGLGVILVLGAPDLGQRRLTRRLRGFRKRFQHIRRLMDPAPLLPGLGEDLAQCLPEAQRSVNVRTLRQYLAVRY